MSVFDVAVHASRW